MSQPVTAVADRWTSRRLFTAAVVGAVVGLGNVWQLPHLANGHGGGLFLLLHIAALLLVGLPLMLCELLIGRHGHGSATVAVARLVREGPASPGWRLLPWLMLGAALLLLVSLAMIGGWLLNYLWLTVSGGLAGIDANGSARLFDRVAGRADTAFAGYTLFVVATAAVSMLSLRTGLERMMRIVLPLMAITLSPALLFAFASGHGVTGLTALLAPAPASLDAAGLLAALGQGFYALLLGAGVMLAFASHLPSSTGLARAVPVIVGVDLLVTLLVGTAVLSIQSAFGLPASGGPQLLFVQLPQVIGTLPDGPLVGGALLAFAALAAWSTAVALMEPLLLWVRHRFNAERGFAATVVAALVWLAGLPVLLAFVARPAARPFGMALFEVVEWLGARALLPLAALGTLLFIGWALPESLRRAELQFMPRWLYRGWLLLLRFVAPPLLVLVFLGSTGILSAP